MFDSTTKDWFFAARLANSLHTITRDYVIEDEFLFEEDEYLELDNIEETERNLRSIGIFANVKIDVDTLDNDEVDISVTTQDRWSTLPSLILSTSGGVENYGAQIRELNLCGWGAYFGAQGLYRTENSIGWQGRVDYIQRKIFRTDLTFNGTLRANKYRTDQLVVLEKQYLTLSTPTSYGVSYFDSFGKDFVFTGNRYTLQPFHLGEGEGWFSIAGKKKDRIFATVYASVHEVVRFDPIYRQAFDNSGKVLVGFSSLSLKFQTVNRLNSYEIEDMPIGAWGTVVLGKTFPIIWKNSPARVDGGLFYAGGQVEQSAIWGNLYVFGQISGGSGFSSADASYTYQEFLGISHYQLTDKLILAARLRQQTAWNWDGFRQLVLDADAGLRGYRANSIAGDNRVIGNIEARYFTDWEAWIFRFSGVLFYDYGTAWNVKTTIADAQFHNAIGVGIRLHNIKTVGADATLRFDIAYNMDENQFGFVFSTSQLFSAFGKHVFKLPQIFGLGVDSE
ncbi:MAG: BamA/TamA family outer membrane protein [Ignavibacteria bacterium]|nr:BamA/TamA family outer membrane protein [Ignavibacteria bacterium]